MAKMNKTKNINTDTFISCGRLIISVSNTTRIGLKKRMSRKMRAMLVSGSMVEMVCTKCGRTHMHIECFEKLECASEVPYYDIVCERGDTECSQRKRRLAREEIDKFKADPGGAAGVFALLALRPLLRLARRDDEEDA